jgi:hypothetical protein
MSPCLAVRRGCLNATVSHRHRDACVPRGNVRPPSLRCVGASRQRPPTITAMHGCLAATSPSVSAMHGCLAVTSLCLIREASAYHRDVSWPCRQARSAQLRAEGASAAARVTPSHHRPPATPTPPETREPPAPATAHSWTRNPATPARAPYRRSSHPAPPPAPAPRPPSAES